MKFVVCEGFTMETGAGARLYLCVCEVGRGFGKYMLKPCQAAQSRLHQTGSTHRRTCVFKIKPHPFCYLCQAQLEPEAFRPLSPTALNRVICATMICQLLPPSQPITASSSISRGRKRRRLCGCCLTSNAPPF